MKKINKNFIVRPKNLCVGWRPYDVALSVLETNNAWPSKHSSIYQSDIVKNQLLTIYNKKCAFCNQIPKGSVLQVEHFRPKNGIKEEVHTGYYWLGYEWTNLLLACGNCNSSKSTFFPLIKGGIRLNSPIYNNTKFDLSQNLCFSSSLKRENHVLINPEIDNPEEHFEYLPSGKIYHLTERGKLSIEIYDLNRDELYVDGRKKILDSIIEQMLVKLNRYSLGHRNFKTTVEDIIDIILNEILIPIQNNDSFDHFRKTIFEQNSDYIIARFSKQRQIILLRFVFNQLTNGVRNI